MTKSRQPSRRQAAASRVFINAEMQAVTDAFARPQ